MNEWTVAIGVDTHKDAHVAVALDRLGAQMDSRMVAATGAGYRQLFAWATGLGCPVFGVEGCGSYGAGLVRFLQAAGVLVYECERPRRGERRRGKSDQIDAALAARRVVSGEGSAFLVAAASASNCGCCCSSGAAPCEPVPLRSTNWMRWS